MEELLAGGKRPPFTFETSHQQSLVTLVRNGTAEDPAERPSLKAIRTQLEMTIKTR
jgi:hypothetical protein